MLKRIALALLACLWASLAFAQVAGMATGTGYPQGAGAVNNTVTGTTAGATATLAGVQGRVTFICGLHVEVGSATAAIPISVTTTGLASNFASSANAPVTAATATAGPIVSQVFTPCQPATGANVAITVAASALGAGGVNQIVNAWGYQVPIN